MINAPTNAHSAGKVHRIDTTRAAPRCSHGWVGRGLGRRQRVASGAPHSDPAALDGPCLDDCPGFKPYGRAIFDWRCAEDGVV